MRAISSVARMLFNRYGLSLDTISEGVVTISYEDPERDLYLHVHALPRQPNRFWGLRQRSPGSSLHEVGLGPFAFVCFWGF